DVRSKLIKAMKKAKKEMTFCETQLIDDTKALQLEFCAISAMIGCNITNERVGQSSLLQFDEQDLKLAHLLFDDVESSMLASNPNTQDNDNEDNSLLNQELAKLFQLVTESKHEDLAQKVAKMIPNKQSGIRVSLLLGIKLLKNLSLNAVPDSCFTLESFNVMMTQSLVLTAGIVLSRVLNFSLLFFSLLFFSLGLVNFSLSSFHHGLSTFKHLISIFMLLSLLFILLLVFLFVVFIHHIGLLLLHTSKTNSFLALLQFHLSLPLLPHLPPYAHAYTYVHEGVRVDQGVHEHHRKRVFERV
ncbi:hypothetical protein TYRP_007424, partial [Tyrophagus putrescentiae]